MADKLVIVESNAKAKTISRYLGKGYDVQASRGHVRDLPKNQFGVDVDNDFAPTYRVMPGSRKIVGHLRKASEGASEVFLAPDPDREGEAIAWHLKHALNLGDERAKRVTFNEITRDAVRQAFRHPRTIDKNLVDAQQARRILDRIVGYELSPLISRKIVRGLSAGRVQSVALRLVVDREREREAFEPEEYWEIIAMLLPEGAEEAFEAKLVRFRHEDLSIGSEEEANKVLEALADYTCIVRTIESRKTASKPPPPFRTSTMQQSANNRLSYNTSQTMRIAQRLYEGIDIGAETVGLITYMRTDSVQISEQSLGAVRDFIGNEYGADYLPAEPNSFRNPRGAQAAHEAIRPTDVKRPPQDMKPYLSDRELRLYELIWRRFVASQMARARYEVTTVEVEAGPGIFQAKGRRTLFPGYMRVLRPRRDVGDQELPAMEEGQELRLQELVPSQHFTQPPPRYTEASLVKELEKQGIGRPSTYAPTISTLQRRNYVTREGRAFAPTDLGCVVTDLLVEHFPREMDVQFTSHMEAELDEIEEGKRDWRSTLQEFYDQFREDLERARSEMKAAADDEADEVGQCPECGKELVVRFGRHGSKFIGCTGFPECRYTSSLEAEGEQPVESEHMCPKCGSPLLIRKGRRGREYLACSAYPQCSCIMGLDKEGNPVELAPRTNTSFSCPRCGADMFVEDDTEKEELVCSRCRNRVPMLDVEEALRQTALPEDEPIALCPECEAPMQLRRSRRGLFLGCSRYPECKGTMNLDKDRLPVPQPTLEECEQCGRPLIMRWGKYGRFLACSGFPKCRNSWRIPGKLKDCPQANCDGHLIKKVRPEGETYWGCTRYPQCDHTKPIEACHTDD